MLRFVDDQITVHIICSALPSTINMKGYAYLNDLPLADSGVDNKDLIDILVGSNYYWSIVTGNLQRGEDGPVTVSSRFGWLLSGPAPALDTNHLSQTHVTIPAGRL